MHLYIKNMVCDRCIMVVREHLSQMGFDIQTIALGDVEIQQELNAEQKLMLQDRLKSLGFELLDDKKTRVVEKIKNIIIELVHRQNNNTHHNLSDTLAEALHQDYSYLSNLFSEMEGITIEKYFIAQKIERVKELLADDETSLSEIAEQMNYSSVAYLSNQFKKVTGQTPSQFKKDTKYGRVPLDQV